MLQRLAHGAAVRRRNDDVQEHDIGIVALRDVEGLAARRRSEENVAFVLKPRPDQSQQLVRIVDDEHFRGRGRRLDYARRKKRHPDTITLLALVKRTGVFVASGDGEVSTTWTANFHSTLSANTTAMRQ
jgi:hypothetical protein